MDVLALKALFGLRLHGFGLGFFFGLQPAAVQHVEEVGIAAGIQLVGLLQFDAPSLEKMGHDPVDHGGAHLRFDVVADNRQIPLRKTAGPPGIAGDEDGNAINEGDTCRQGTFSIEAGRLFRSHRQVIYEDFRPRPLQFGNDILFRRLFPPGRNKGVFVLIIVHMAGHAVQNPSHMDDGAGGRDMGGENRGAIG